MNHTLTPSSTPLGIKAFIWAHVLPYICLLGVLTNILNVIIFSNRRKLANSIYNSMLAHSLSNTAYLAFSFAYFFGANKIYKQDSYLSKLLEFYLLRAFTTTMAIFMIFLDIQIAIKRLLIVTNYSKSILSKLDFRILISLFLALSVATQIPFILSNEIRQSSDNSSSRYEIVVSSFGKTPVSYAAQMSFFIFRGLLAPIFLCIVNIIMMFRYKNYIHNKLNLQLIIENNVDSEFSSCQVLYVNALSIIFSSVSGLFQGSLLEKSRDVGSHLEKLDNHQQYRLHLIKMNNSITLMVIANGFLFLSCNFTLSVTGLLFKFFPQSPQLYVYGAIMTNLFLYSAHSLNIFIYFYFDRQYRSTIVDLFVSVNDRIFKSSKDNTNGTPV